jgi:1-aminocyclopropane-1-carboxylate deaminase/D-cysteine desulfhydrase-like pyridoxal-dependent ACC family enzyme
LEEIDLNLPSPIETITVDGASFFLKRDDLIHGDFSGNKARKLYCFLENDFPDIKKLISYGSNQSNAMYSMSVLAKMKGWEFEYFTDHVSEYLSQNPHGNYAKALENGMKINCHSEFISESKNNEMPKQVQHDKENTLFINEGGRNKEAAWGVEMLADEIIEQAKKYGFNKIFLPSGTGTTALFLQRSLIKKGSAFKVYTTPCVGDRDYLIQQFNELEPNSIYHPVILKAQKKYHFGKLYKELYNIWLKLQKQTNIEFDLLYDPIGWSVVLDNMDTFSKNTLYIHQGGLIGNISMLQRYERKYKELF